MSAAATTMKTVYTTAPIEYDGFSTRTVAEVAGRDKSSGKVYRQVEIKDEHFEWQTSRYASGMHAAHSPDSFAELVEYGLVETDQSDSEAAEPEPPTVDQLNTVASASVALIQSVERVNRGMWQVPHATMQGLMRALQDAGIEF